MSTFQDHATIDRVFADLAQSEDYAKIPNDVKNDINKQIYEELAWKLIRDAKKKLEPKKARRARKPKNNEVEVEPVKSDAENQ